MKHSRKAVIFVLIIGLVLQQFLLFPAAIFGQDPGPGTPEPPAQPQASDPETPSAEPSQGQEQPPSSTEEVTQPQEEPEPEAPAEPSEPEEPTEPQTTPSEEEPAEPEQAVAVEEQLPPEEPAPVESAPSQEPAQSLVEDLSSIGAKEGFGEEGEAQTALVPQEDKNITVVAKIEEKEIARANREGLAILKGDIETRPEEVLFFQEEGVKKQVIELSELVGKEEAPLRETETSPREETSESIVTQGGDGIVLDEVAKREQGGAAIAVNVEDIVIQKKGDGFLQRMADTIFGGGKDDEREERVRIEVTSEGVVRMIAAENIEGDEKIEIEYSYGTYTKPFEVSFVPISLSAAFSVDSLSEGEVEQAIINLEQPEPPPAPPVEEITPEEETPEETIPAPPVVETAEEIETPETIPSEPPSSSPPTEEPPSTPTTIEEPEEPEAPSEPIEPPPTEPTLIEEAASPIEETIVPVTLPEEGAVQGVRVQNLDADAESGIINRVKKFFQSFLSGAPAARAQESSQTVQAFQVKLKAATVKGEQTFQILPNGLVYLYHGSSIEAISRPRFQYLQTGNWTDFAISGAAQGTQTEGDRAMHLIQFTTAEGDIITLKYDFGLLQNEILKKQSWTISGDKTARVLWETLFRAGTPAQKELASTPSVSPHSEGGESGGSRTRLYGDIVIDTSDYAGNVEIEEDSANNIVRVYFEKDGKQAPFTIDPSFSVVTGDQFIEVATPDFGIVPGSPEDPGTGWKIRFNRLKGGGIDQYFHNSVNNGETNIASSTKPLFNIGYTNSSSKLLSQTQAYSMEVIERGATRLRVRSRVNLGNDQLTIIYTVYLAGQIYIDVENVLQDGSITAQSNVFQLNQSYIGYQGGFAVQDNGTNAVAIDGTQIDSALVPFATGDVAGVSENQSEAEDYIQIALGTNTQAMYANGNTASNQFLLSLRGAEGDEAISIVLPKLASDYQTPDTLVPFTIGTYQGYNNKEGAYEMTAEGNKVEFAMNGASQTRYDPIFKISNWNIPVLALIFAKLNNGEIKQDLDYIVTFQNSDPNTRTLIFQYLGEVSDVRTFYIDPTCTSTGAGNWSSAGIWDCGVVPDGDDTAVVRHAVTINQDVTILGITIDTGGKLNFDTTARTVTVNENAGAATITVGEASGGSGELECRPPTTGVHTIKLNSTTADAAVGIVVESTGILDIQGTSSADQDCVITNGGVTLDGTRDGYIYLKDGSETVLKNADISYMGTNVANKNGIQLNNVDGNSANEGLVIEGSKITNGFVGIRVNISNYIIINNNTISGNAQNNISLTGDSNYNVLTNNVLIGDSTNPSLANLNLNNTPDNNTISNNVVYKGAGTGISLGSSSANNYVYNNTIDSNGDDGILIDSTSNNNFLKNNLISNIASGKEGIDNDGTSNTISNNYFYYNGTGGTAHCTNSGVACASSASSGGSSGTPNSTAGTNPSYVSTTTSPLSADFLYLSEDSPALAVGIDVITGTARTPTNCNGGTVPCINVGGRLDFVRNGTHATPSKYNWLQAAHDDATGDVLTAGDTVTAYANNVVSDTIYSSPAPSNAGQIGTAYYQVKFNATLDATVTAADQHEGFYAYFTSGSNRGRYYLVIDSTSGGGAGLDTITLLSTQAATTFTAGDGFTIVDRVYNKRGFAGSSGNGFADEAMVKITKQGNNTSPITWNTSGTVMIDASNVKSGFWANAATYNIIDGFIVMNSTGNSNNIGAGGIGGNNAYYAVIRNNTLVGNARGIGSSVSSASNGYDIVQNNEIFNGTDGMLWGANYSLLKQNKVYNNSQYGVSLNGSDSSVFVENIFFQNLSRAVTGSNKADDNVLLSNTLFAGATGVGLIYGDNLKLFNNAIVGNSGDGIDLDTCCAITQANGRFYNNIIAQNDKGIDTTGSDSMLQNVTSNFNDIYNNTTANVTTGNGYTGEGTGSLVGNTSAQDPAFSYDFSTAVATGTAAYVDVSGTQAWSANQWIGYALTFTGGSCPAAVLNKWFGITSNTAENLFYKPTPTIAPDANCTAKVTNFYVSDNSVVLGAGASVYNGASLTAGNAQTATTIGARLDYVYNNDAGNSGAASPQKSNWLQAAHDNSATTAGDTITTYAVNYRTDTLGSTLADSGPYLTLDTATEATIAANDDYIGFYMYMTSGTNRGKYYLIIDSAENTSPTADTISISATDGTSLNATGFNPGDGFTVVDRVYTRESGSTNANCTGATENLCLYTSGTATAPVTWGTSGSVIIDSASARSYGIDIAGADYNIVSGFAITGATADGIRLTNVNNSRYANLTVARNTIMGINDGAGNQDNLFETNTVFSNTSHGIGSVNQSLVSGNTVYGNTGRGIDVSGNSAVYNNLLAGNANSIFVAGAGNTVRANRIARDTVDGVVLSGAANNAKITNNMIAGNTSDGIDGSAYSGTGSVLRNNLIINHGIGINSVGSGITSNFNYLYNTTQVSGGVSEGTGSIPASGSGAGTEPDFAAETNGFGTATGGSTTTLVDTGKSWTINQWANYVLHITGGTGANQWALIVGNTATTLYVTPVFGTATASGSVYEITNFYLVSTSGTTPLGNGAKHDGTTGSVGVNMGTRLGYVSNYDGTRNNGLQYAHDASATGAGDTLTVYAVEEVTSGTVSSAADNGPYITLTLSTDSIAVNDDYIGMYVYITSGTNANKYYLIIDSATVAGPADTIAINTAATTGFAATDTFKIIDRVYSDTGWTSGATTANVRFTKDGASGSPITWNAVANNTVLIDAAGKTYAFYGDTDGTNGLKYNNFQTAGTFTFVNVSNGANLYQGGFGFNTTGVVHDHINWGGATDSSTIFNGQYISKVIDMTQADPVYGKLVWGQTVTSGTSDLVMHTRSTDTASGSDIATKTFVGPDGTANTSYTTEAGENIADAHNGHQYFQYRATFTTTSTDTLPELTSASVSQEAEFTSSWFNTEDAVTLFNDIIWTESNGSGGAIPSDSDVRIQVRTAPNNSGAPGSATSWCGPNDGTPGSCTSATYFTDSTGATEALDDILTDATNDQWIQYKVFLIQTGSGKPYLEDITLQYVVNTSPTISVTSASQGADGVATVAYSLSDAEEQGEDGAVVVGLYYERGVTIAEDLDPSETDIDLTSATTLPLSGTILVDNEIISYTGKSGNTLTGGTRHTESSKEATHSSGAAVFAKAVTVSGNAGTITAVTGTPSAKSATWMPKTDINGVYDATFSVRVVANDGNAANQIAGATSSDFVLDTKDPVVDTFSVNANAAPGATDVTSTLAITKTDESTVTMSIANNSQSVGGTYSAFESPTNWSLDTITSAQKTVYLKLKDAKGNTSTTGTTTTPVTPSSLSVVDISNVGTGDYRFFISWKKAEATDVPAFSSYKMYRKAGSGGVYTGSGSFTLITTITNINTNYIISTNLDGTNPITQSVQYDYFVVTESTNGNTSYRSNGVCGIPDGASNCSEGGGGADATAPTIIFTENTGEGTPSNSRVTITFQTYDLPSVPGTIRDAKIDYGTSSGVFTLTQGIPTATSGTSAASPATRAVTLEGLSGSTTYYYRITVRDATGNIGTDDNGGAGYVFATTNEPGTIISNVQSILINATTVKITWTTDKVASSQVIYATNSALTGSTSYPVTPSDSDTSHEVQITGITAGTTYYYKARSVDANSNTSDSAVYSFTTADSAAPVISQVASTNVTNNSATVTFATNEVASSSVNYGASVAYGSSATNTNFNTTHVFNLTGLSPETVYYYKVNATDAGGNLSTSDNSGAGYTFTTFATPSAVISNVRAVYVSATAVDVKWDTTVASSSQVQYGTDSNLAVPTSQPTTPSDSATSHTISLSGLGEATRYYYRVISGANQSSIYNFLTGDTTAPTISSISAVYNDKTAVISWTTNEAATSQVEHGLSDSYGSSTSLDSLLSLAHAVTLTSLTPATTYYFRVKSQDGLQNAVVSAAQSFTTNAGVNAGTTTEESAAPTISNIAVLASDDSAVVSWATNKDATSQVEYGALDSYGTSSILSSTGTKDHLVRITGLTASTTYHYRVKSQDAIGNLVTSADQVFTTNAGKYKFESQGGGGVAALVIDKRDSIPAQIVDFTIEKVGEEDATLSWRTNEPSVTLLGYGKRAINDVAGNKESIDNRIINHTLVLTQLRAGSEYKAQPFAIDAGGNVTQGTIASFTTKGEKPAEAVEEEKKEEEAKEEEKKPADIAEEEEPISEEGRVLLTEEFEKFIKKLEVYLGPPVIVGVTVSDVTDSSAVINWKTTVPAASILDYGASETYGELVRLLQFDQEHSVTLKGLREDTVYHYRIKGVTESGQLVATQDMIFRTTEIGKIVNFSVNDIQEHSIIVSWKSNVPTTSEVEFGVVGEDALERQGKDALATTHKLLLTGLKEKTKYRIRVVSRDAGAQIITNDFTEFTTSIDDRPPLITELEAEGLLTRRDSVRVIVSWDTDEPGTSQVFYEVGVLRGRELKPQTLKDENFTTDHTVLINDFQPGTLYQIRAQSLDRAGNVGISEDYTIITPKKEENIIDIIVTEFQDAFGFLKR